MEQMRTHVGDGGGRWSGGNITTLFSYLSTFSVLALSASFLARRSEGFDVTNELNAICEELARRYGIDLCRVRITSSERDAVTLGSDDAPFVVALGIAVILLIAIAFRRTRSTVAA